MLRLLLRLTDAHPAVCAGCLLGIHVAHTGLGIHGFEGLEAVFLQAAHTDRR
jgi:hypothetical protein